MRSLEATESGYITPALAATLMGRTPFEIRDLLFFFDGTDPDDYAIRRVHRDGRLMLHLGDLMAVDRALRLTGVYSDE